MDSARCNADWIWPDVQLRKRPALWLRGAGSMGRHSAGSGLIGTPTAQVPPLHHYGASAVEGNLSGVCTCYTILLSRESSTAVHLTKIFTLLLATCATTRAQAGLVLVDGQLRSRIRSKRRDGRFRFDFRAPAGQVSSCRWGRVPRQCRSVASTQLARGKAMPAKQTRESIQAELNRRARARAATKRSLRDAAARAVMPSK